jgi:hypothetical protein
MQDQLTEAIERAAEFGGGPARVWTVPEDATVEFGDGTGHPFEGMTVSAWQH